MNKTDKKENKILKSDQLLSLHWYMLSNFRRNAFLFLSILLEYGGHETFLCNDF